MSGPWVGLKAAHDFGRCRSPWTGVAAELAACLGVPVGKNAGALLLPAAFLLQQSQRGGGTAGLFSCTETASHFSHCQIHLSWTGFGLCGSVFEFIMF